MQATKADIEKLHEKLNPMAIDIGSIKTWIELQPEPVKLPERPCTFFTAHVEEHKEVTTTWRRSAIRACVDVIKMAIVAVVVYFVVKRQ